MYKPEVQDEEEFAVHPTPTSEAAAAVVNFNAEQKQKLHQLLVALLSLYRNNDNNANIDVIISNIEISEDGGVAIMPQGSSNEETFLTRLAQSMNQSRQCILKIISESRYSLATGQFYIPLVIDAIDLGLFELLVKEHVATSENQSAWKNATLAQAVEKLQTTFPEISFSYVDGASQASFDHPYRYIQGYKRGNAALSQAELATFLDHPYFESTGAIEDIKAQFIQQNVIRVGDEVTFKGDFIIEFNNPNTVIQRFIGKPVHGKDNNASFNRNPPSAQKLALAQEFLANQGGPCTCSIS